MAEIERRPGSKGGKTGREEARLVCAYVSAVEGVRELNEVTGASGEGLLLLRDRLRAVVVWFYGDDGLGLDENGRVRVADAAACLVR